MSDVFNDVSDGLEFSRAVFSTTVLYYQSVYTHLAAVLRPQSITVVINEQHFSKPLLESHYLQVDDGRQSNDFAKHLQHSGFTRYRKFADYHRMRLTCNQAIRGSNPRKCWFGFGLIWQHDFYRITESVALSAFTFAFWQLRDKPFFFQMTGVRFGTIGVDRWLSGEKQFELRPNKSFRRGAVASLFWYFMMIEQAFTLSKFKY